MKCAYLFLIRITFKFTSTGGTTVAKNKNRIGKVIRTKDARSSVKSFKSSTRPTNYTYDCKYSDKRIGKKKIIKC